MRQHAAIIVAGLLGAACSPSGQGPTGEPQADPAAGTQPERRANVHDGLPSLAELADGWNTINPGGDTMCVYGTPYGFFVRPDDPRKLLVTFPGGGACWS
ncbi:MAG: hypothetical protein GWN29_10345, partial [Gammaproteobacteria bacterium]|nr:hypothetical protein [Gammaproteobacteria bacterium]